jgi:hypothetical protein
MRHKTEEPRPRCFLGKKSDMPVRVSAVSTPIALILLLLLSTLFLLPASIAASQSASAGNEREAYAYDAQGPPCGYCSAVSISLYVTVEEITRTSVRFDLSIKINATSDSPPVITLFPLGSSEPIDAASFEWTPVYPEATLNTTWRIWSVQEIIVVPWSSYAPWNIPEAPILLFPFEEFVLTMILVSPEERNPKFYPVSLAPGFTVTESHAWNVGMFNSNSSNVLGNVPDEILDTVRLELDAASFSELEFAVGHSIDYQSLVLAMDFVLVLVTVLLIALVVKRKERSLFRNVGEISLAVLLFLPIFQLTFRLLAPPWPVSFDIYAIGLISAYSVLLTVVLVRGKGLVGRKEQPEAESVEFHSGPDKRRMRHVRGVFDLAVALGTGYLAYSAALYLTRLLWVMLCPCVYLQWISATNLYTLLFLAILLPIFYVLFSSVSRLVDRIWK